ncbi:MAG: nuoJ [Mycobacterium sp.]|jgi:NADH-quinone oxidoreductase subunit J|nr:nuoJ [Mycobacterium sp.]
MSILATTAGSVAAAASPGAFDGGGEAVVFWVLAPVAVLAALGVILVRNAVHAALLLVLDFFCLAVFYAVQDAPFLAAVQVIVYAGAIMVLFLFVLMLVGSDASDSFTESLRGQRAAALLAGVAFGCLLVGAVVAGTQRAQVVGLAGPNAAGNVHGIARLLYSRYVLPFEVTSALLVVAAVGAMVLGHRPRTAPKVTQQDRMRRRFRGDHPSPLPAPGVFALSDALDGVALLPDGEASELSRMPSLERGDAPEESPGHAAGVGSGQASGNTGSAPAGAGEGQA